MVFQDYALFPHMDVADNIAYPLRIKKVAKDIRRGKASEVADNLSLDGLLERRPGQLSGGQQQRVALARAVTIEPDVLLLDEPLSNLDARLRLEARTFLKQLQRDLKVTTVFVTHDQAEALALADRIAVMKKGKLQQIGSPKEIFQRPANTFVAGFIGSYPMNLLEATVESGKLRIGESLIPAPVRDATLTDGQKVIWGVRPEYVTWVPGAASESELTGTVTMVESLGASSLVSIAVGEQQIQIVVDEDAEPTVGDQGYLIPRPSRGLVFDAETTERID